VAEAGIHGRGVGGLILAGGRGARMQEADKGLVPLDGLPLVAHVAQRLAPQVERVLISANRNPGQYAAHGRVLADDPAYGRWPGPLAGVAAGLAVWPGPWLVVVPCDTPFLPADLALRLVGAAEAAGAPLAVARAGGRRHAVCMAARTHLYENLRAYLAAGDRKVDLWQDRAGAVDVDFGAADAFMNLNTPQELAQARGYASQYRKS